MSYSLLYLQHLEESPAHRRHSVKSGERVSGWKNEWVNKAEPEVQDPEALSGEAFHEHPPALKLVRWEKAH